MTGYRDGPNAVEFYKGTWILRCAFPSDLPITDNAAAQAAMTAWLARNREKSRT